MEVTMKNDLLLKENYDVSHTHTHTIDIPLFLEIQLDDTKSMRPFILCIVLYCIVLYCIVM
jgi:hypothetical protein